MPLPTSMAVLVEGQIINRFTVLRLSHKDSRMRKFYLVRCSCGTEKTVNSALLISGNTQSCGCLAREIRKAQRLPNDRGMINQIILQAKRHAKDRGLSWRLTYNKVDRIVRMPCAYCGIVGGNIKRNKNNPDGFRYNGIDRIDSSRGYTNENVAPCCRTCNVAKNKMSVEDFQSWIKRLVAMASQWG